MKKRFKLLVLGALVGVTVFLTVGGSNGSEDAIVYVLNSSDKAFDEIIFKTDTKDIEFEAYEGKDLEKDVKIGLDLPKSDTAKIKAVIKKKGKTVATSPEIEVKLKKKYVNLELVDINDKEIEIVTKKK